MFHECRHIKTNGQRCHAASLRGKPYCWFHMNLQRMHSPKLSESQRFQLPPIEDNASILLAVGQVVQTLKSPYADTKRAGLILYALQIAAQLTARSEYVRPQESVRVLYSPENDEVDFAAALDNGTVMLAPDKTICEPPHDCRTCSKQNTCDNYEEPEEEEEYEDEEDAPNADEQEEEENEGGEEKEDDDTQEEDEKEEEDEEGDNDEDEVIARALARALAILNQSSKDCHSDRP